ncbi:MAG: hypothetical protein J6P87_01710 [Lachnospiraceae bacterium]|nr:hypothetical protein [Lachnospiraceae bacterium]
MLRNIFSSRYDDDPDIPSRSVSCALLLFMLLEVSSYYAFYLAFPFVWTMNYRYIEVILPVQSLLIMETCRHNKTGRRILLFLIPFFCLLVILFFIGAGRAYS